MYYKRDYILTTKSKLIFQLLYYTVNCTGEFIYIYWIYLWKSYIIVVVHISQLQIHLGHFGSLKSAMQEHYATEVGKHCKRGLLIFDEHFVKYLPTHCSLNEYCFCIDNISICCTYGISLISGLTYSLNLFEQGKLKNGSCIKRY